MWLAGGDTPPELREYLTTTFESENPGSTLVIELNEAGQGDYLMGGQDWRGGISWVFEYGGELAVQDGTGIWVAASLVLGTKLFAGAKGAAGEIGHLPYKSDGPACGCGQRGCLERYISGTALDAKWPSKDIQIPSPVALFDAAENGDTKALEVRNEFLDALAHAIEVMVLSWDPERIILGGGVAGVGNRLLTGLKERLDAKALPSAFLSSLEMSGRVELVPPHIHVAALGAALVARGE